VANRKLGRYEVIERLGRGGMAEVYRGYHISLDRYVAIKVLHPFLADDPEFKMRFEKEARNVAKLKHPNIVQVYDFEYDSEGESYYMVMELVEGPTLKDHLFKLGENGERMPLPEALRVIREAASALAYAHSLNMIHRDVKPANLMQ
jgi:serine/threonine protein kinase